MSGVDFVVSSAVRFVDFISQEPVRKGKYNVLAPDYAIVDRFDDPDLLTDTSTLLKLGPDHYLCAVSLIVSPLDDQGKGLGMEAHFRACKTRLDDKTLRFYESRDAGQSWERIGPTLRFLCGHLFSKGDDIYFIGVGPERRDIWITGSGDRGASWSNPVRLFEGRFYVAGGAMAIRDGILYWTVNAANEEGDFNVDRSRLLSLAGNTEDDLLDPATWRCSNYLVFPGVPDALRAGMHGGYRDHWLEPNTILVNGRLRVMTRVRIDKAATAHVAAICELVEEGNGLALQFKQFYPVPGAQLQFYPLWDEPSGLIWMTSNLPVCTQGDVPIESPDARRFYGRGNDRRFLWLSYSMDALNWFPAGCVAAGAKPTQAFNYCSLLADGDDLLVVSRTSLNMTDQHNNDHVTFHRVRDFRSLALTLL